MARRRLIVVIILRLRCSTSRRLVIVDFGCDRSRSSGAAAAVGSSIIMAVGVELGSIGRSVAAVAAAVAVVVVVVVATAAAMRRFVPFRAWYGGIDAHCAARGHRVACKWGFT